MGNAIAVIFGGAILLLSYWVIKKIGKISINLITRVLGSGDQFISKKVETFLSTTLKSQSFIKDFAKIIQDEGGIDEFVKKTKYSADTWTAGDQVTPAVIWYGYKAFEKDENGGLDLNKNAVRIVDKLLKTSSFKSLAKKDKLTDREISTVGNYLFLTIVDDEFKKVGDTFIKTSLQKTQIN